MKVFKPNFKRNIDGIAGLATVIIQDQKTDDVLMQAYTDEAGWRQTLETGKASLYSTSRKKSWVKGEESGNFMHVVDILVDCDGDTLIYFVEPQGNKLACHTGARTCFYRSLNPERPQDPAPEADEKEELEIVEATVHSRIAR